MWGGVAHGNGEGGGRGTLVTDRSADVAIRAQSEHINDQPVATRPSMREHTKSLLCLISYRQDGQRVPMIGDPGSTSWGAYHGNTPSIPAPSPWSVRRVPAVIVNWALKRTPS